MEYNSWKQNLTPSLVLSSDKSQRFDSGGPLNVIHCSPFTPHKKGLSKQQFTARTRPGQPSSKIHFGMSQ